jgi:hypothetical protein
MTFCDAKVEVWLLGFSAEAIAGDASRKPALTEPKKRSLGVFQ